MFCSKKKTIELLCSCLDSNEPIVVILHMKICV